MLHQVNPEGRINKEESYEGCLPPEEVSNKDHHQAVFVDIFIRTIDEPTLRSLLSSRLTDRGETLSIQTPTIPGHPSSIQHSYIHTYYTFNSL